MTQLQTATANLTKSVEGLRAALPGFKARVIADRAGEIARLAAIRDDASNSRLKRAFAAGLVRKLTTNN